MTILTGGFLQALTEDADRDDAKADRELLQLYERAMIWGRSDEPTIHDGMIWKVEQVFHGRTVFVAGNGPSLTQDVADRLRGHPVVASNCAIKLMPHADVFFTLCPRSIIVAHEEFLAFPGLVVSGDPRVKRTFPVRTRLLDLEALDSFPPAGSSVLRYGGSSGGTAIALALLLGAKRVVLVGFDMRVINGREHFHDAYTRMDRFKEAGTERFGALVPAGVDIYQTRQIPALAGWRKDAEQVGCSIINCTPGSALEEFEKADLEDVISSLQVQKTAGQPRIKLRPDDAVMKLWRGPPASPKPAVSPEFQDKIDEFERLANANIAKLSRREL